MSSDTLNLLLDLKTYKPSRQTNRIFERLVSEVVHPGATLPADPVLCRTIRHIASESEYEMELHWSRRIARSPFHKLVLRQFPYIENYKKLVRQEVRLLEKSGLNFDSPRSVLVIGSGPLPLTSYFLSSLFGAEVDNVDVSSQANALARRMMRSLGVEQTFLTGDGASLVFGESYDVIMIAGLAGDDDAGKQAIVDNVLPALKPDGRVLMRSAKGARALLYPEVNPGIFDQLSLVEEFHPSDDIINSVLIFERKKV